VRFHFVPTDTHSPAPVEPNGGGQTQQAGAPSQPLVALGQMLERITAMQREEAVTTRQFLGVLHDQAQMHSAALERLLAGRSSAAPVPAGPSGLAGVVLQRMTAEDDVQSYLETFDATAEACGWPADEWAVRLLPLLAGEAQTAALGLPPAARRANPDIRKAVVDRLGLSPEDHRRRFREAKLGPEDRPFAFAQQLMDAAARWLQPGAPQRHRRRWSESSWSRFLVPITLYFFSCCLYVSMSVT